MLDLVVVEHRGSVRWAVCECVEGPHQCESEAEDGESVVQEQGSSRGFTRAGKVRLIGLHVHYFKSGLELCRETKFKH